MGKYPVIDGVLTIPEGVVEIRYREYYNRQDIIKVILPSTMTYISSLAFQECQNLESINIPDSVQCIDDYAFSRCLSLTSIHIPALTQVGKAVFEYCHSLRSITVSEENPYIDSRCNCNAIIDTATDTLLYGGPASEVPRGVKAIGKNAFRFCDTLKSIVLPEGLTKIESSAFVGCHNLETINLPEGLETIGDKAFLSCEALAGVDIPSTVKTIGSGAFQHCFSLTRINIPACAELGHAAFAGCGAIESISVDENNPTYDNRGGCNAIIETRTNTLIKGCKSTVIPESVKEIGHSAFFDCKDLETINIPQTVTAIGCQAFSATGLKQISLPDGLMSIGDSAFDQCVALISIKLPKNLKSMGTFEGCTSLKAIEIPSGVEKISKDVFKGCSSLSSITFPDGSEVYDSRDGINAIIEKKTGKLISGCNGTVIPDNVTSIGGWAFYGSVLSKLIVPKSVIEIDSSSFSKCTILESISVEEGNPMYDSRGGCNAIIETATDTLLVGFGVTVIPEGIKAIRSRAFDGCVTLTEIAIPAGIKTIPWCAFRDCVNLKTVTLPVGVSKVEWGAFQDCHALECINVPFGKVDFYKKRLPEELHSKIVELPKPDKKKLKTV